LDLQPGTFHVGLYRKPKKKKKKKPQRGDPNLAIANPLVPQKLVKKKTKKDCGETNP